MYVLVALCNRSHLQPNALRMRHILTQSQLVCHSFMCHETLFHCNCWRPYHVECTGSLLTSEVKRHRARLVLGWGTAWEDLRVLPASLTQQGQDQKKKTEGKGEGEGGRGRRKGKGKGKGKRKRQRQRQRPGPCLLPLPLPFLLRTRNREITALVFYKDLCVNFLLFGC